MLHSDKKEVQIFIRHVTFDSLLLPVFSLSALFWPIYSC